MKTLNTIQEVKKSHSKISNMTGDRFAVIVKTQISKTKEQFGVQYWTRKQIDMGVCQNTDNTDSSFVELFPQTNSDTNFTVSHLAIEFANILKTWLTVDQLTAVNARNESGGDDSCATHDFCDANEAMAEAFEKIFANQPNIQSDADLQLMNSAWSFAKTNKFFL